MHHSTFIIHPLSLLITYPDPGNDPSCHWVDYTLDTPAAEFRVTN